MRAVNLLPREDSGRRRKRMTVGLQLALISPFVVGSLLGAGYLLASSKLNANKVTLKALQSELAAIPPPAESPQTNAQLALQRDQRVAALGTALQARVGWDRILREISSVLPGDVWLTGLDATSPEAAPVAAPLPATTTTTTTTTTTAATTTTTPAPAAPAPNIAPLKISGYTYSQEGVARFLGRLSLIPELHNVRLVGSTQTLVLSRYVFQFSIQADVPSGAPTS
jgi:Tfp pilus assembly protein PilN